MLEEKIIMSSMSYDSCENKELWEKLYPYLEKEHPCIVCGNNKFELWAKKNYLEAKQCVECNMISVNPHLSEEGLNKFYSGYFTYRQDNQIEKEQREVAYQIDRDWVSSFVKGGNVLDVGCSGGFFLSEFPPERWGRYGVEIAADAAKYAKDNFDIPVYVGNIVELEFDKRFDLVMLRGVIEHFREPINVLRKCCELLTHNGYLLITATPAGDSFAFEVYRENWRIFTPIEHIHFFSVKLLNRILGDYGMKLVSFHYQYEETPYANPSQDYRKIQEDIVLAHNGQKEKITGSVPFPGSMITALWQKTTK